MRRKRFRVLAFEHRSGYAVYSVDDADGMLESLVRRVASLEELALIAAAEGIAGDFDPAVWRYEYGSGWRASDERLPF